jgi:hypothetical protein
MCPDLVTATYIQGWHPAWKPQETVTVKKLTAAGLPSGLYDLSLTWSPFPAGAEEFGPSSYVEPDPGTGG